MKSFEHSFFFSEVPSQKEFSLLYLTKQKPHTKKPEQNPTLCLDKPKTRSSGCKT